MTTSDGGGRGRKGGGKGRAGGPQRGRGGAGRKGGGEEEGGDVVDLAERRGRITLRGEGEALVLDEDDGERAGWDAPDELELNSRARIGAAVDRIVEGARTGRVTGAMVAAMAPLLRLRLDVVREVDAENREAEARKKRTEDGAGGGLPPAPVMKMTRTETTLEVSGDYALPPPRPREAIPEALPPLPSFLCGPDARTRAVLLGSDFDAPEEARPQEPPDGDAA